MLPDQPNEARLREILSQELGKSRRALFSELTSLGLDFKQPLEQQADLRHLRKWRVTVEKTGLRMLLTVVTLAVTGFISVVWAGVNVFLGKH